MAGANIAKISKEERALAATLIEQKRLTVWELQQGLEWCERNAKSLFMFLERFGTVDTGKLETPETDQDGPGRRNFVRHDAERGLEIEVNTQLVEVSTLNISRGGLAFKSAWALDAGTEIKVGAEQRVRAIVRYCVDNGDDTATTGAEFVPKTVDDLQAIEALMTALKVRAIGV